MWWATLGATHPPPGRGRPARPALGPRAAAAPGLAHAVNIDFDELPELWDELGHMDPSPAVDRWWVLTSQQRQFHTSQ